MGQSKPLTVTLTNEVQTAGDKIVRLVFCNIDVEYPVESGKIEIMAHNPSRDCDLYKTVLTVMY